MLIRAAKAKVALQVNYRDLSFLYTTLAIDSSGNKKTIINQRDLQASANLVQLYRPKAFSAFLSREAPYYENNRHSYDLLRLVKIQSMAAWTLRTYIQLCAT